MEVDIVRVEEPTEEEATEDQPPTKKEKVNLGQVLELAVQSMSVTMEEEETQDDKSKKVPPKAVTATPATNITAVKTQPAVKTQTAVTISATSNDSAGDDDDGQSSESSDFEWKLDNGDDGSGRSPPAKKKKMGATTATASASGNYIVPTVKFWSSTILGFFLFSSSEYRSSRRMRMTLRNSKRTARVASK